MFNQNNPKEAINRYVGDVYIQHNPVVGDGKEAFIEYFKSKDQITDLLVSVILFSFVRMNRSIFLSW